MLLAASDGASALAVSGRQLIASVRRQGVQLRYRDRALVVGICLLVPVLTAPNLEGLGPPLVFLTAATIASPIAVILLWAALGGCLKALGRALILTNLGVVSAAVVLFAATSPSDRPLSDTASFVGVLALMFSALPAVVAIATSVVLLPFAWRKSRSRPPAAKHVTDAERVT